MATTASNSNLLSSSSASKQSNYVDRTDSSESSTSSWDLLQNEPTTVIELGSESPSIASGRESPSGSGGAAKTEDDFMQAMRSKIVEEVGGQVWAAGKSQARRFFDLYSNIDVLRPYFDVEPKDILIRLAQSLVPRKPLKPQTVAGELYGPIMVVFTLVALLLFSMKHSGHTVQEGTLMGTAIGVCFGYWLGGSSLYYFMAYLCNAHITLLQIVSLTGYALFSHCICIFLATVTHETTHGVFFLAIIVIGGLSSLRMLGVYVSRTWSRQQGMTIGSIVGVVHLLFLLYLHYAYHDTYEEAALLLSRTKREAAVLTLQTSLPTTFVTNT